MIIIINIKKTNLWKKTERKIKDGGSSQKKFNEAPLKEVDDKQPLKAMTASNKDKVDNGSWANPKFIQGYISHNIIKKEKSHDSEKSSRTERIKEGSREKRHK